MHPTLLGHISSPESKAVPVICKNNHTGNNYASWIGSDLNSMSFQQYPSQSGVKKYSFGIDYDLTSGKYVHVVAIRNKSSIQIWVNNELVLEEIANYDAKLAKQSLFIGYDGGYGYRTYKGLIDEVRIYNRALSSQEIQQLYATTLETNISPKDSGTITKSPEKTSYSPNEEITLTAKPAKGYKFKQWQGDASGSDDTITIKMNGNQNVTAVFEEKENEKPPIEISSKAIYDSTTNTLSLEGILVPFIDEFTGKATDNKGIFDVQLQEKTKLVFELIPWSINFKDIFKGENTSGYILYDYKTRTVQIPCFEVMTIAKLGDGIEGKAFEAKVF